MRDSEIRQAAELLCSEDLERCQREGNGLWTLGLTVEEAASSIVDIVDSQMADLIRKVTVERGLDPALARDPEGALVLGQLAALHLQRSREEGRWDDVIAAESLARRSLRTRRQRNGSTAATLIGALGNKPFSIPEADWQYAGAAGGITGTTDVVLRAATAAGIRNYVTSIDLRNAHATVATEVVIKDGATVIWRQLLPAAMATP